jgi:ADP-ribose pyrophosphatase
MASARDADVELHEKTTPYRGYFRVDRYRLRHRLFGGGWSVEVTREVFERGHAVAVLPYDPRRDGVVLIEQFRMGPYAVGEPPWLMEIVAGIIDQGEEPEDVARRELLEEAGLAPVGPLVPIGRYFTSPGGSTETIRLYYAAVDSAAAGGIHGLTHEGEDIRAQVVDFATAMAWLDAGRFDSSPPIIALMWLQRHRDRLRAAAP